MSATCSNEIDSVDVAVAAFVADDDWQVEELDDEAVESLDALVHRLRRFPAHDVIALVSVDEDFMLIVRLADGEAKVLLSDASAATDWVLARSVIDYLAVPVEDDDAEPAGDFGILADCGLPTRRMAALLDDDDLYPDEILSEIAEVAGFGVQFDELAGLAEA